MVKFKFKKKGSNYTIKLKFGSKKFFNSISKLSDMIKEWIT